MYRTQVPIHPADEGAISAPLVIPDEVLDMLPTAPMTITERDRWSLDCLYMDTLKGRGLVPYDTAYPAPPVGATYSWTCLAEPEHKVKKMRAWREAQQKSAGERKALAKLVENVVQEKKKKQEDGKAAKTIAKDAWKSYKIKKVATK